MASAHADRTGLARLLVAGLAQVARRGRDQFSLTICAGDRVLHEQPPTRRSIADDLLNLPVAPAGQAMPQDRILVTLISDFEVATAEPATLLSALRPRPVLPIWLRDSGLENPPQRLGLVAVRDPETGRRRTVLTTPRWAMRQAQATGRRHAALRRVFAEHGLVPVEVTDSIDVVELAASLDEAPL